MKFLDVVCVIVGFASGVLAFINKDLAFGLGCIVFARTSLNAIEIRELKE